MDHETQKLRDFIVDVWAEIDNRFGLQADGSTENRLTWLNLLGIFQSKADMFGLNREECGLPAQDADILFIRNSGNGS